MSSYRVIPSMFASPAHLARARRYARIEDAVADMGEGVVIATDGHVAAFHEKHERIVAMRNGEFEPRFYATRNDAGVPTVIDNEDPMHPEDMPGSSMWDARWTAAHYNGDHDLNRHPKCPVCATRGF